MWEEGRMRWTWREREREIERQRDRERERERERERVTEGVNEQCLQVKSVRVNERYSQLGARALGARAVVPCDQHSCCAAFILLFCL